MRWSKKTLYTMALKAPIYEDTESCNGLVHARLFYLCYILELHRCHLFSNDLHFFLLFIVKKYIYILYAHNVPDQ